ncbi:hypothetical protein OIE66_12285 [Nonomuraea sp. NBC_01738]|uniref:ATP-binding protein n=1 Tax=Nonomuraea sp. NBC_01738 TaxID=2976003 RepID=UPI002E11BE15|nr:hypothetical protein OIE66_12285 [Nonomuraea sp. NBC_01738]
MRGLEEELARLRERRFDRYDPAWLSRLALLPHWTDAQAETLRLDPVDAPDLIESTTILLPDGEEERTFWLRESLREELGAYLRRDHPRTLATTLTSLITTLTDEPQAASADWLNAARMQRDDPTGVRLISAVSALTREGRAAEAARLVSVAKSLADIVGGHLAGSARRAGWYLARTAREAEDAHHLRRYQPRSAIQEAVDTSGWAVHLLGPGGAGKTMLIRHLSRPEARGTAVARVDFDHLDPRYPEDRPGEMFLALGVDLLGHAMTRAAVAAFEDYVALTTVDLTTGTPTLPDLAASFAGFLRRLPPALLILDTCEELAKLYPPGEPAPGIDITFTLLELLHDQVPTLKVLLAGRRHLVPPPTGSPTGPLLRPRPYLRVIEVAGFTPPESRRYLTGQRVPGHLHEPILANTLGPDGHNPFDLAAYADWIRAEPALDPHDLLTARGDPYIERRIIGRIRDDDVTRCLGVAAELGTFGLPLVSAEFARLGADPAAVVDAISGHEWARVTAHTPRGRPAEVELEENLRRRLRAVTAAAPSRFLSTATASAATPPRRSCPPPTSRPSPSPSSWQPYGSRPPPKRWPCGTRSPIASRPRTPGAGPPRSPPGRWPNSPATANPCAARWWPRRRPAVPAQARAAPVRCGARPNAWARRTRRWAGWRSATSTAWTWPNSSPGRPTSAQKTSSTPLTRGRRRMTGVTSTPTTSPASPTRPPTTRPAAASSSTPRWQPPATASLPRRLRNWPRGLGRSRRSGRVTC